MKKSSDFSDEIINACVDGELNTTEKVELLESAKRSDELRSRLCGASLLKASVQDAYPLVGQDNSNEKKQSLVNYKIAVSFALIAMLSWWLIPMSVFFPQETGKEIAFADPNVDRVVFHISTDDDTTASAMMDQVQLVLQQYQKNNRQVKVHVVANNAGLRNFQKGRSSIADRLQQLDAQFDNVVFAACGNTIQRFHQQKGEVISVLPSAVIIQSGVSYLARRQAEGWVYIKV